jgi:hypothetical protein
MGNVFQEIGHGVKVGAEDVGKGVEKGVEFAIVHPIEFLVRAQVVLADAIKDSPEVKSAVLDLVKQATTVIGDTATDIATKGINLSDDQKTLSDAEAFFTYFKNTFIPLVEQVYKSISSDATAAAPVPATPATATTTTK